jgi:predicted aspartyl protease
MKTVHHGDLDAAPSRRQTQGITLLSRGLREATREASGHPNAGSSLAHLLSRISEKRHRLRQGRRLISLALVFAALIVGCADETPTLATNGVFDERIPLESRRGLLLTQAFIDGGEARTFLVDTGSQYVLIEQSIAEELGYHRLPSRIDELSVGSFTAYEVEALPWDLTHFSQGLGVTLDGVLGATLFRHLAVAVDTQRLELVILGQDEGSARLLESDHIEPSPLSVSASSIYGLLFADVELEGLPPVQFLLDTGASTTFLFQSTFEELDNDERPVIGGLTGVGAAGELDVSFSRICGVNMGEAALSDLQVGVIPDDSLGDATALLPEMRGLAGATFFREFLTIFDSPRRVARYYRYTDRSHINDDDLHRVGVFVERQANGNVRIVAVLPGTDAERRGLEVDDVIVSINGVDVRGLDNNALEEALSGVVGEAVELGIQRSTAIETILVAIDDLLPSCGSS